MDIITHREALERLSLLGSGSIGVWVNDKVEIVKRSYDERLYFDLYGNCKFLDVEELYKYDVYAVTEEEE